MLAVQAEERFFGDDRVAVDFRAGWRRFDEEDPMALIAALGGKGNVFGDDGHYFAGETACAIEAKDLRGSWMPHGCWKC